MKIWGIGLGRTATKSLHQGLELLNLHTLHNPPFYNDLLKPEIDGAIEGAVLGNFKNLDLRFPDSKFILTIRALHSWLQSAQRAIETLYPLSRLKEGDEFYNCMIRNWSQRYGALNYDEDKLIEKYYQHHADVIAHFKGRMDQLLIIDLTAQNNHWKPLCTFLNKDIPTQDFPHVTEAK